MIEVLASRNGPSVIRLDGRYLASSIDPIREAASWAERALRASGDKPTIFVVGVGCGYHVAALKALARSEKHVIAMDPSSQIVKHALMFNPTLDPSDIVVEIDKLKWTANQHICDALLGEPFAIVTHAPTAQIHPEWVKETESFLLAREKTSFLLQLRLRPELFAHLDPKKIEAMGNETVSIKTLQSLFRGNGLADRQNPADSRERRIWRVLEELVL